MKGLNAGNFMQNVGELPFLEFLVNWQYIIPNKYTTGIFKNMAAAARDISSKNFERNK